MPKPKANKVPPVKPSPSPNKTPNPEGTAPGVRGQRPDGGLGRGGVRPGRCSQVRTWLHVAGIRRGLCPPWRDLQGLQDPSAGAEVGRSVKARERGAWELTLAAPNRQVRGGPFCLGGAPCQEGGSGGRDVGREEGRGAPSPLSSVHRRSCPPPTATPRTAAGRAASSHTHSLVYSVLLYLSGR